jgi:acyl carrier protein
MLQVSIDEPLMAAGLDSLASVELRNALESALQMSLPPTFTIDYPSVAAMAQFIGSKLQAAGASSQPPAITVAHPITVRRPGAAAQQLDAVRLLFGFEEPMLAAAGRRTEPDVASDVAPAPSPAIAALPSSARVKAQVSAAVAAVLGKPLDSNAALMASGLDSLSAVELQNILQDIFKVALPATLPFNYPSITAIAQFVHSELAKAAGLAAASSSLAAGTPAILGSAVAGTLQTLPGFTIVYGSATRLPGMTTRVTQHMLMASGGLDVVQTVPLDR